MFFISGKIKNSLLLCSLRALIVEHFVTNDSLYLFIFLHEWSTPANPLVSTEADAGSLKQSFSDFSDSRGLPNAGSLSECFFLFRQFEVGPDVLHF